ncbi:MAG: ceramidase [Alphaproteobacteria bacterium]|nr:ceramidase [Alphaproteobacteria bacterium]
MQGTGFWTGMGAPSVVDWCEPNYVVTPYVAEWWNTISSLWLVALGVFGLWRWWHAATPSGRRFGWCFAGLLLVGLGSVAFHGTLLRGPQALDELPMVYVGLLGAWVVRFRDRPAGEGRGVALAFAAYAVVFTAVYAWATSYFLIFLASYSLLVTYMALTAVWLSWIQPAPRLMAVLLGVSAGGFLGTLFFCWMPEHVFLPCDHPAQRLQLHAIWHLGSGLGTYAWFLWAIVDRWRVQGIRSEVAGGYVQPVA